MMFDTKPIKTMRVKIKKGAPLIQNNRAGIWPFCCPPDSEYAGEEYKYVAKNPDMEFEARWTGQYWRCKANGYGSLKIYGDTGEYGNGSIFVYAFDGVEILQDLPMDSKPPIVMRNPKGLLGIVEDISDFWVGYDKIATRENFDLNLLIEDCLYGLAIAIDQEGYEGYGYDKFIKDLKKWLDSEYQ
jgi:hypothetical protein